MMILMMMMMMEFRVHRVVLGPKSPVLMTAMDKEEVKPMLVRDVDSNTMQVRDVCECVTIWKMLGVSLGKIIVIMSNLE